MNALEQMFPALTLFSDLDWVAVTQEYESDYIDISFPEYLQQKALDGDCPPYLFELAYYELAMLDVKTSIEPFPYKNGIYLNPTALFLSLEFDIKKMMDDSLKGTIEVHERPNVLCIFKDTHDVIHRMELPDEDLGILQHLEDGPKMDTDFLHPSQKNQFQKLVNLGLILTL